MDERTSARFVSGSHRQLVAEGTSAVDCRRSISVFYQSFSACEHHFSKWYCQRGDLEGWFIYRFTYFIKMVALTGLELTCYMSLLFLFLWVWESFDTQSWDSCFSDIQSFLKTQVKYLNTPAVVNYR